MAAKKGFTSYAPGTLAGETTAGLAATMQLELRAIASVFDMVGAGVLLTPLYETPIKTKPMQLVYADGANWDPGAGEGVYVRNLANTAWIFLGGAVSSTQTALQFKDEGSALGTAGTVVSVNFTGGGVTASRSGDDVTVNVPTPQVSDGDKGDVVVSSSGTVWTVDTDVVTNTKLANMANGTFKGRTSSGTGDPEDLTAAQSAVILQGDGLTSAQVGFRNIPQNSQSAAYTTVAADSGKHIFHPSADTTARTFTIDSNANVAYPVGTAITFINQNGAGTVTIAITSDTMRLAGSGTTGSRTLAANGVATAVKVTSTEWIISGTGLT